MHKIPAYRWPPTQRLLAARFSADLEQVQNRYFSTSNRSKPIGVLTRTKSFCRDDRLPISYSLPDFQLIWSNFLAGLPLFFFSLPGRRGSTLGGGLRLPQTPQGRWCHWDFDTIIMTCTLNVSGYAIFSWVEGTLWTVEKICSKMNYTVDLNP